MFAACIETCNVLEMVTLAHRAPRGGRGAGRTAGAGGAGAAPPILLAAFVVILVVLYLKLKFVSN